MNDRRFPGRYQQLKMALDSRLAGLVKSRSPRDLTNACRYVLAARGKRVRGILVILSCEAVGGSKRDAFNGAMAVEMLHNFTLVHDDIMDRSSSRRGRPTVHTRWNVNTALLVGDVLIGLGYDQLLRSRSHNVLRAAELFTEGLRVVCKGQAQDLELELRSDATLREYFDMIEKKTAGLISMSTEMGAVLGGGQPSHAKALADFGHYLGRAFQVQDDLLDVVAERERLGKPVGADIRAGKKTFLLLTAIERSAGRDLAVLRNVMRSRKSDVRTISDIYRRSGAIETARRQIERDTRRAIASLGTLPCNDAVRMLQWFAEQLVRRVS